MVLGWVARRRLLAVTGAAATGALLAGLLSLAVTPTYEAQAVVALQPIDPAAIYGPGSVPGGEVAVIRQLELARSSTVTDAIAEQLVPGTEVRVEVVGVDRLGFVAQAGTADAAVTGATAAGAVYGAIREDRALAEVEELLAAAEDELATAEADLDQAEEQVDDAEGADEQDEADDALGEATAAVEGAADRLDAVVDDAEVLAAGTAYLIGEPVRPGAPISPDRRAWVVTGLLVGLVGGLVLLLLARRAVPADDDAQGERSVGAAELDLPEPEGV